MAICKKHGEYEAKTIGSGDFIITLNCPQCNKEIEAEQAKERESQKLEAEKARVVMWQEYAHIPKRYRNVFEFNKLPNQNIKQWDKNSNIINIGGVGGGKTTYLCYLANTAILEGKTVRYTLMSDIETKIKDTWGSKVTSETQIIKDLSECDLLIIDELGRGSYNEWIFKIIDNRYNESLPTIFAGNISIDEFKSFFGDAIVSRIKHLGVIINTFGTQDLRL